MNAQTLDATPRKLPRQARSRATVDAIVSAVAQVLIEHGYEGATTARVAERAGVSIGSLYQYFPNKDALVAALIERHANEILAVMLRALRDPGHTLEDGLCALIHAGADAHRLEPALHKILNEQIPRVGRLAKVMDTSRKITLGIEQFLRAHAAEMRPGLDPAVAAVVVETAIEALSHKAVLERRDLLVGGLMQREALALVTGYVSRAGSVRGLQRSRGGARVPQARAQHVPAPAQHAQAPAPRAQAPAKRAG